MCVICDWNGLSGIDWKIKLDPAWEIDDSKRIRDFNNIYNLIFNLGNIYKYVLNIWNIFYLILQLCDYVKFENSTLK